MEDFSSASDRRKVLLAIKFKLYGTLRFLSHAELLRLFRHSAIRAGLELRYSQGFNPHPKISLPLPKSTGIELDEDMLCLQLESDNSEQTLSNIKSRLSQQLPTGLELTKADALAAKTKVQPVLATYLFHLRLSHLTDNLEEKILSLMGKNILNVARVYSKLPGRNVNVRPFLESIRLDGQKIVAKCRVCQDGSIRPGEIIQLLQLNAEKLAKPIRRSNVQWLITN
ncbi:MAG: DUF2344 domain-containing protein [Sedimentisphaerales bacterium]|nr:DUF2344 domain-containing protein [Sedimentisphaerales bacterium]